jgi:hypothetical protein
MPAEIWTSFREVRLLRRVVQDPGTGVRIIAAAEGIGVPLSGELSMNTQFSHTTSSECKPSLFLTIVQEAVFCPWLLARCVEYTQLVANILFTDEAEFTRDDIVNFHNTHARADVNPHTTVASTHQHRLSINVWVDILSDQVSGPVVLSNRLTDAVYHRFSGE